MTSNRAIRLKRYHLFINRRVEFLENFSECSRDKVKHFCCRPTSQDSLIKPKSRVSFWENIDQFIGDPFESRVDSCGPSLASDHPTSECTPDVCYPEPLPDYLGRHHLGYPDEPRRLSPLRSVSFTDPDRATLGAGLWPSPQKPQGPAPLVPLSAALLVLPQRDKSAPAVF